MKVTMAGSKQGSFGSSGRNSSIKWSPLFLAAAMCIVATLAACSGGGSSTPPPAISVALTGAPPASLAVSATTMVTATVSNDSANRGVDWTVTCGSAACGSFSPAHTASGVATTYTAPAAVPTGGTVMITATSTADGTKSASAPVTITAAAVVSIAFTTAPPASLQTAATAAISATVSNDPANLGVDWTVTCGTAGVCGSFSSAHTASGTATTYTAPAAVPTGGTVTITATSTADGTKSVSATVTITAAVVSIAFTTAPPASLQTAATATVSATVTNDPANLGVDWTVTCGSVGACGSFSPAHTASGVVTTYTAPATVPTGGTVTITATATADPTKTVSAAVTITPPPPVSIVFTMAPPSSLQIGTTATMSATVSNDPANKGVDWIVTCGSASCGSFSPAHTASGVVTTYTAPATVPTGGTVTITATSTADNTKSVSAPVTISVNPPVTIVFTMAPPTSLQTGTTATTSATVGHDPANLGVDWTVTCGSASCGSFSPAHTASGIVTTYTAPATVPTGGSVTITATATADPTKTVFATVTITPPPPVSIAFAVAPPATLLTLATAMTSATVTNDPANLGVDWTVTCGSAGACGSFSPTHTASGAATTYTAPSAVPTGGTVTITATASADHTKTVLATVTITPAPPVSIAFTVPPPISLNVTSTATVNATVTNDPAGKGVDWTVTCGSASCGSFNPAHTASGAATTYTAPAAVPTGTNVTIIATATADTTKTVSGMTRITMLPISVTFVVAPPATLAINQTASISATVTNDINAQGVNWTATCVNVGACGTFNPTQTGSGVLTVYTAPAAVPTGGVTIAATSVADNTKSVSATVFILNPLTITFAQAPPVTLTVNGTASVNANVFNDPNNLGVDWTVTCGTANACGSFNPPHTASGTATIYTAPPAIPAGGTVTIIATSTFDPTKSVSATVAITTNGGSNALLTGSYVFALTGHDTAGFYTAAGTIVADGNGTITSGEEDFSDTKTTIVAPATLTGTYTVGPDGRGSMTLTASDITIGVNGVQTLNFALISGQHGSVIEADPGGNAVASGTLDFQAAGITQASITGAYSFVFAGEDVNATTVLPLGDGGVFVADGAGNFNSVVEDQNEGGLVTSPTVTAATFTAPDTFGRGTATFHSAGCVDGTLTCVYAYYAVDGTNLKFIEEDNFGVTSGSAFAQGAAPTLASLVNSVFTLTGTGSGSSGIIAVGGLAAGGVFSTDGNGNITSGTLDINNFGTQTVSDGSFAGTYTVASNGRGTLSLTGTTGGITSFAVYFTASQGVQLLETDNQATTSGIALAQQTSVISAATFSGGYAASWFDLTTNFNGETPGNAIAVVGQATADGVSALFGNVDINQNNTLFLATPFTGTFAANSNGRFTGTITPSATASLTTIFYVANPSTVLFINSDSTVVTSGILQLQSF